MGVIVLCAYDDVTNLPTPVPAARRTSTASGQQLLGCRGRWSRSPRPSWPALQPPCLPPTWPTPRALRPRTRTPDNHFELVVEIYIGIT